MGFEVEILADSIIDSNRLTTFRLKYQRFVHAECLTHRIFSRNSASSRAVPCKTMRKMVLEDPAIPVWFGRTQKGMQADKELTGWRLALAKKIWLWSRYPACLFHWIMEKAKLHKQLANRIIEPWLWIEVVLSGTEFQNFFSLRNHKDAQPEIQKLARMMQGTYITSIPVKLKYGEWHIPFSNDIKYTNIKYQLRTSAARCARTSYYLFDGKKSNPSDDHNLYYKLVGGDPIHSSPTEHQAMAVGKNKRYGNFVGWLQHRKLLKNESGRDNAPELDSSAKQIQEWFYES